MLFILYEILKIASIMVLIIVIVTYKFDVRSAISIDNIFDYTVNNYGTDGDNEHIQLVDFFSEDTIQHVKQTKN